MIDCGFKLLREMCSGVFGCAFGILLVCAAVIFLLWNEVGTKMIHSLITACEIL